MNSNMGSDMAPLIVFRGGAFEAPHGSHRIWYAMGDRVNMINDQATTGLYLEEAGTGTGFFPTSFRFFQPEPEFLMTNPVPVVPEPEFSETNLVPARTGFQYRAGIPAGTGILQTKFWQNPELQKSHWPSYLLTWWNPVKHYSCRNDGMQNYLLAGLSTRTKVKYHQLGRLLKSPIFVVQKAAALKTGCNFARSPLMSSDVV